MADQLALDVDWTAAPELVEVSIDRTLTLREQWQVFHDANPLVYAAIVSIARDLRARGFRRCGIALIYERLRWNWALQTRGDEYKLNANWRAHYAREIMRREPDLAGFFVTRRLRAAGCTDEEPVDAPADAGSDAEPNRPTARGTVDA